MNKEERSGRWGGQPPPTLGLEVITVLCTQNNWSHQCGCHMESLALPRHRCSPFSGQNPPIKPKPVAKRPLAATPLHPSYPPAPLGSRAPTFTLQSKARPTFQGKQRRTRSRGVPGFPSDTVILCVATSGNDLICTSAVKLNVTAHASCQGLAFAFYKIAAFGSVAAVV